MALSPEELQRVVTVLELAGFEVMFMIEDVYEPEPEPVERWDVALRRLSEQQFVGAR